MNRLMLPVILLCLCTGILPAQTPQIDSLRAGIYRAANEKEELAAILRLCEEYQSINRDTLDHYAYRAKDLAAKTADPKLVDLAAVAVADDYYRWGWLDSALATINPVIAHNNVTLPAERPLYFKATRRQALYYGSKMKYPEALAILYKLVNEAEKYNDSVVISTNINTIGSIALIRETPQAALQWFYRALGYLSQGAAFDAPKAALFSNLSEAYFLKGIADSAVYYSGLAIDLYKQQQNLMGIAMAYQRQSKIFLKNGDPAKAEAALKEMIEARQATQDGNIHADDNITLVEFYLNTKQVDKAIAWCTQYLKQGNLYESVPGEGQVLNNALSIRLMYYELLARAYKQKGDLANYQQLLEQIILAKDSLAEAKSEQVIAEMQTKYEVQKKENTIIQQQLTIVKKNNVFYRVMGVVLILLVISFVMFRDYRKKQRVKVEAAIGNEKRLAARAVADAEENERKRIAADLHDNLGAYAASIASNLEVLQSDQLSGQHKVALQELNQNSQTMVSQLSDTIWALNKDSLTLTAISDRIKVFLSRIGNSYPGIRMDVQEDIITDMALPPTQAFHLFQIIQEAITNAVKHSGAGRIRVGISGGEDWQVSISDDGKGMDERNVKPGTGNGLRNMKERASVSGWSISWKPAVPQGTMVLIQPVHSLNK
ncbi:MAG: tetratricopeptide repeat-containing sensor histidine kinase [Pseudobacter sp.]|uniref:tetratricopeptide repeat-containing sensor histidine kinase n=1 Tax=Pseudobacter sp. TaxID=2045420 RepID=UPI003F81AA63